MKQFLIDGTELTFIPSEREGWFTIAVTIYINTEGGGTFYAWVPFDMTTVLPESSEEASQFVPDALHFVNETFGGEVVGEQE